MICEIRPFVLFVIDLEENGMLKTDVRDAVQKGLFDLLDFQEEVVEELREEISQLPANP